MSTLHYIDTEGSRHTLATGSTGIILDGKPGSVVVKDSQITLISSDPKREGIIVAPAMLWQACAGGSPTPEAAGLLLAEMLARHGAMQEIAELALRVRPLLDEIERHIQEHRELSLPTYHFDAFTLQLLRTYDGTEEHVAALARLLKQSPETILAWLTRVGLIPPSAPAPVNSEQEERQHEATPGDAHPKAPDTSEKRQMFRWTSAMIQQLRKTFFASDEPNVSAAAKTIAQHYGWPAESVEYKIYHLDLPREREQRHQQDTETSTEQEESQTEGAVVKARMPDPEDSSCHLPASLPSGPFLWDVKIDGKLQRWPLDVAYGMFPCAAGSHVVYREKEYVLQQVWHSIIEVAYVVNTHSPTVRELVEV